MKPREKAGTSHVNPQGVEQRSDSKKELSCFPASERLIELRLEEFKGSMYSFYEAVYGLRMIRAEERIRAVTAGEAVAAHLRVPPATPLLCVDRIAFTYGDMPVEWRRGLCLTDGSYYNELA